jgi:hypothetical protein
MVRKQLSIHRSRTELGLAAELALLAEGMRTALFAALDAYDALGIRFALVGGLAVGSYAEPRATKDIAFLVGMKRSPPEGRSSRLRSRCLFRHIKWQLIRFLCPKIAPVTSV